jgi:16S rRNA (cytosine1402-N4)-methyltransferase
LGGSLTEFFVSRLDSGRGLVRFADSSFLFPITAGCSPSLPSSTTKAAMRSIHQPVLVDEVLASLTPREGANWIIVDGTVGGGGHAVALARRLGMDGRVIGLDRDSAMLDLAKAAVSAAGSPLPVTLVHAAYRDMRRVLDEQGIDLVQGVLLDVGLSSDQLAWNDRGFSFSVDGPLDMRFDRDERGPSAADVVNNMPEAELARLFFELGEERFSRRIARRIVEDRAGQPIETTGHLAELVRRSVPVRARHGPIDPATRVFQALRIAVNDELGQLDAALELIPDLLASGGRAAVISFHSLEDRRVKWAFKTNPKLTVLTKKPMTATARELAVNPRARSAKLRVVERCPNPS